MDEGEWTCAACTFRHVGIVSELRECTICGSSRPVVNAVRQPESRRSVDPAVSRRTPSSQLLALPDDVLQRVLAGPAIQQPLRCDDCVSPRKPC